MIAVVDSGGANIASVMYALERLEIKAVLTDDVRMIANAPRVILPGVGAAKKAMKHMADYGLIECIRSLKQPVLGICLGMQLLFSHSQEGDVDMLGIIERPVKHFLSKPGKTIPHMGWNSLSYVQNHPLTAGIADQAYVYFVHSYYAPEGQYTLATCDYDETFSAIIAHDNFMGCQFHPERSGLIGARILKNFTEINI